MLPALSTTLVWFVLFFAVGFLSLAVLFAVSGGRLSWKQALRAEPRAARRRARAEHRVVGRVRRWPKR